MKSSSTQSIQSSQENDAQVETLQDDYDKRGQRQPILSPLVTSTSKRIRIATCKKCLRAINTGENVFAGIYCENCYDTMLHLRILGATCANGECD